MFLVHRLLLLSTLLPLRAAAAPDGPELYQQRCALCHGANGQGVEGVFPPLATADFLAKHRERALRAPLEGLMGKIEVNGHSDLGGMPPVILRDEEVAAVFGHVFASWGNALPVPTRPNLLCKRWDQPAAQAHRLRYSHFILKGAICAPPTLALSSPPAACHTRAMKFLLSVLLLCTFTVAGFSQGRRPPVLSPEIREDHAVTFRLRAPQAREVALRGQWTKQPLPLARGEDGVWSLTTPPIAAGVWEYSFAVDGVNILDPANPALKPQREPGRSILHLPGTPAQPWDFQDVPHGAVHQHSYLAGALGRPRELWVYTPPGYETAGAAKYPLCVLQHGSGDNHKTWVEHGKAHWILDSLIAAGKAQPMIVMMLDGHPQGQVPREDADKRAASLAAFQRELFEDALPLVEARYRVEKEREHRAIAGLSMGGWQALNVGLNHLDRFAWIGSFSGVAEEATLRAALDDSAGTNARLKLLWIAVGKDDFLRERNETLIAALQQSGLQHEWQLTEGDHSWPVWRRYLVEFAPKLFQR